MWRQDNSRWMCLPSWVRCLCLFYSGAFDVTLWYLISLCIAQTLCTSSMRWRDKALRTFNLQKHYNFQVGLHVIPHEQRCPALWIVDFQESCSYYVPALDHTTVVSLCLQYHSSNYEATQSVFTRLAVFIEKRGLHSQWYRSRHIPFPSGSTYNASSFDPLPNVCSFFISPLYRIRNPNIHNI